MLRPAGGSPEGSFLPPAEADLGGAAMASLSAAASRTQELSNQRLAGLAEENAALDRELREKSVAVEKLQVQLDQVKQEKETQVRLFVCPLGWGVVVQHRNERLLHSFGGAR